MVCYDFCAGFALRPLCWEVWGVAQIWEAGKVMEMRKGGLCEGGDGGLSWKFYIQIPMAEHAV